jgi:hypothetical protein
MARGFLLLPVAAALIVEGCGEKAPKMPADPVDQAATCGVIAAASERESAGLKGDLPADSQVRILHYAMLYGSSGKSFDRDKVNAVSRRMPALFDQTIKGQWQTLRATCASAFPATQIKQPTLPPRPVDAVLQCYVLADFLRKALADQGSSYAEAVNNYGVFTGKLDTKLTPLLRAAGLPNGAALQAKRSEALAAATNLGPPPAVIDACEKKYD